MSTDQVTPRELMKAYQDYTKARDHAVSLHSSVVGSQSASNYEVVAANNALDKRDLALSYLGLIAATWLDSMVAGNTATPLPSYTSTVELLQALHAKWPTGDSKGFAWTPRHVIAVADDGRLVITLVLGEFRQDFVLDAGDMVKSPAALVSEIEALLASKELGLKEISMGDTRKSETKGLSDKDKANELVLSLPRFYTEEEQRIMTAALSGSSLSLEDQHVLHECYVKHCTVALPLTEEAKESGVVRKILLLQRTERDLQVRPEFSVHMLNEEGKAKAVEIALCFSRTLNELESMIGPCRELSIVKTKLEEACFFAKRGMASLPKNQV